MRKALVLILAAVFVLTMASVAYAADPANDTDTPFTFIETPANTPAGPEYNANIPTAVTPAPFGSLSGASAWAYKDASDWAKMYGTATKYEGSYEPFGYAAANLYDFDVNARDRGPHGGYTTTTQKCKVCHAVHRAEGAYVLLRTDTADDACSYCHIGDHRHSVVSAYWESGNSIYPSNGHTIGAGKDIPDSTTWQWREEKTLSNLNNQTGLVESQTFSVRRYLTDRVKLMRITGSNRVGPTFLRCMSCHQVHNASNLIWKPYDSTGAIMTDGYKLLRKDPSGLIAVNPVDINPDGTIDTLSVDPLTRARLDNTSYHGGHGAPEPTQIVAMDSSYTGEGVSAGMIVDPLLGMGSPNSTGYTTYFNEGEITTPIGDGRTDYGRVEEVTMAVWCSNCHNLNIAGKEEVAPNWGGGGGGEVMLTDRSHVVPMAYTTTGAAGSMGSQCQSCHNSDIPRIASAITNEPIQGVPISFTAAEKGCGPCHVSPTVYRRIKQTYRTFEGLAGGNSLADWPHAGSDAGFKLLNDVPTLGTLGAAYNPAMYTPFRPASGDGLDKVCGTCHMTLSGSHAVGVVK